MRTKQKRRLRRHLSPLPNRKCCKSNFRISPEPLVILRERSRPKASTSHPAPAEARNMKHIDIHIEKTERDHYRVTVNDEFIKLDETVDGAELLGMLKGKDLIGTTPERLL